MFLQDARPLGDLHIPQLDRIIIDSNPRGKDGAVRVECQALDHAFRRQDVQQLFVVRILDV